MPASKKKSPSVTLAKHVEESIKLLDKVATLVTVSESALTPLERKHSTKLKLGGETVVPVLAALADRFEVSIGGFPVSTMTEKMQLVQTLLPLLERAELLQTQLHDAVLHANAQAWDTATVLYSTLRRISRKDANVKATLAPVEEFFARRHPSVTSAKSAKAKAAKSVHDGAPQPTPPVSPVASGRA